jgi:hypothetical protein
MECKKRFLDVLAVVKDDKRAVELIGVVFSKIINYATVVYDMETLYYVNNVLLEPDKFRDATKRLDEDRTRMHNSLIEAIGICNKYLFGTFGTEVIPPGGVYSQDPIHLTDDNYRNTIGSWAGDVFYAFFKERRL